VKEGLGTISRPGGRGDRVNFSRVCGREGIGIISRDHFIWGFGIVGMHLLRWDWVIYTGLGVRGDGGKYSVWEGGQFRDYIYDCLGRWIGDCARIGCEEGVGNYIPGRADGGIGENGSGWWEGRNMDYN
jgi:hypothetical protein